MSEHKRFESDPSHLDETAKLKAQMRGGRAVEIPARPSVMPEGTNPNINLKTIQNEGRLKAAEAPYKEAVAQMRYEKDEENVAASIGDVQRLSDAKAPYEKAMSQMRQERDLENAQNAVQDAARLAEAEGPYQKAMAAMRQEKDDEDAKKAENLAAVEAGNREFFRDAKVKRNVFKEAVKGISQTLDELLKTKKE